MMSVNWHDNHFGFSKNDEILEISSTSMIRPKSFLTSVSDKLFKSGDNYKKSRYAGEFSNDTQSYCFGI